MNRRGLLLGAGSVVLVAPAIVRVSSIMPIKPREDFYFGPMANEVREEAMRILVYLDWFMNHPCQRKEITLLG